MQKNIYKHTVAEIFKRFSQEMKKKKRQQPYENSNRQYEKRHFTLNKTNIKPTTIKTPKRERSISRNIANRYTRKILPIKFESIDVEKIQKAAVKTQDGSGPSGMDADGWKRILKSKQFEKSSIDLCKAFTEVIKKICSIENQSASLEAFLACRLIPLNKNPGLRPIGMGEVLRRITGKVVIAHFRTEIVTSLGSL